MTTVPQTLEVDLEVESCEVTEGRYGPSWKLKAKWGRMKYPTTLWERPHPGMEALPRGGYKATLTRGKQKRDKSGEYEDHYWWDISELILADGNPPPSPVSYEDQQVATTPSPGPVAPYGAMTEKDQITRRSIERQKALDLAIVCAGDLAPAKSLVVADLFYAWISAPPEAPVTAPETPQEPGTDEAPPPRGEDEEEAGGMPGQQPMTQNQVAAEFWLQIESEIGVGRADEATQREWLNGVTVGDLYRQGVPFDEIALAFSTEADRRAAMDGIDGG